MKQINTNSFNFLLSSNKYNEEFKKIDKYISLLNQSEIEKIKKKKKKELNKILYFITAPFLYLI